MLYAVLALSWIAVALLFVRVRYLTSALLAVMASDERAEMRREAEVMDAHDAGYRSGFSAGYTAHMAGEPDPYLPF